MAIGEFMDPAAPPAEGENSWSKLLQDPVARSALLSFGLQAMTGGWGNGAQQMGQAIGAGATGAAGTAEAIRQEAQRQSTEARADREAEAERSNRRGIAQLGADSRAEVAGIRAESGMAIAQERVAGMLERAKMIHGPNNDKEMKIYSDARTAYMKKEKDNQLLSRKSDEQIIAEADAWAKTQLRGAREETGVRSIGAPLPGGPPAAPGGVISPAAPGAGKPGAPVPTPGPGAAPSSPAQQPSLDKLLSDPKNGAKLKEFLSTPDGQQRFIATYPQYRSLVDEYNRRAQAISGAEVLPPTGF